MFSDLEWKKRMLKYNILNKVGPKQKAAQYQDLQKLHLQPKNSSRVRIRNFCTLTGKARSVYRDFRLSRHQIRRLALKGDLVGIRTSSF
jgi:small subunit ribosomal protein S14